MERLTQWTNKGASLILDNPKTTAEAQRQVEEKFMRACNKLAEYEDAEEQGLLVRLPCKVGDRVYLISRFNKSGQKHIAEHFIAAWKLHSAGHCIITTKGGHDRVLGTSAFTTKEAAQKALEGEAE